MHSACLRFPSSKKSICSSNPSTSELRFGDSDKLVLTDAPEGGYRLSTFDPGLEREMETAQEGLRQYRSTLRDLSK
ncbi:MAG: AbrB/MazE/SpoVT family DNA-binding domain-containing protein [Thiohalocapsa sp.]